MRIVTKIACMVLCFGGSSLAATTRGEWSQLPWDWNPVILLGLGVSLFAYLRGLTQIPKPARSRLFGFARPLAFLAGISALFVVLISPLDALDDQLFTAHMFQHLVLMMVSPPLLLLGRPGIATLFAFPLRVRRAIGRTWVRSGLQHAMHRIFSPMVVWILSSIALWFWHLPGPFGWALSNEFVHAFEHFCFFGTSLLLWAFVLEPAGRRRLGYGATMLLVATFGLQNGMLGALLTFSTHPLYAAYLPTTAAWNLTPLEDQQLAGVLMWIPASLIHLTALGCLFVAWLRAAGEREDRMVGTNWSVVSRGVLSPCVGLLAIVVAGLSGCGRPPAVARWNIAGSKASRGPALVELYGCGSCHTIPGARNAKGNAGPPLGEFGRRVYVAGMLTNNPENLIKWLRAPQSVVQGNAMPDMGVTERDARDLAAYLYSLPDNSGSFSWLAR